MRKSKRSFPWEEPSPGPSREPDDERDDLEEEIIDLEEVVEPRADAIEENDELAFDVEILDAETGLDFRDFERKTESEDEFLLEGDLLKELSFFQDRKATPEPPQETHAVKEKLEDSALGALMAGTVGALEETASSADGPVPEEMKPADDALPVATPVAESISLDDFVAQIESRLVDTVREMVASRLPEIVRTVLREEIDRLKNDHEPEA